MVRFEANSTVYWGPIKCLRSNSAQCALRVTGRLRVPRVRVLLRNSRRYTLEKRSVRCTCSAVYLQRSAEIRRFFGL